VAEPKLVVTETKGGSKITLVGASGTPLLSSKVFSEPRGKGATLRALKGLLGEGITVDDQTAPSTVTTTRRAATKARARKPATSTAKARKRAVPARGASKTARAAKVSRSRRRVVKKSARA
jgi:hypothetical protein